MLEILGLHEVATPAFVKAVLAEFFGTAILIVAGCGSVVTMDAGGPLPTLTPSLTFGMTVAFIVYTFNHASGAHINPAVTLGFLVTGKTTIAKTLAFSVAQCCGAMAGASLLWYMIPSSWRGTLGSTVLADGVSIGQGFAIEAVSTFMLMLAVQASADQNRTDHQGSVSLSIGLVVFMQSAWAGKPTGCSMNPARTLGPALMSGTWDHHWLYWVAPSVGSVLGSLLYHYILAQPALETWTQLKVIQKSPLPARLEAHHQEELRIKGVTTGSSPDHMTPIMSRLKEGFHNHALEI